MSGFWFLVSGFSFLVSCFWFLVSGARIKIMDVLFLVSGFWCQDQDFRCQVPGSTFRVPAP
jgi:hypothetical protein